MRVYELADELNQSSQEILRMLNQELEMDISSHMSSIEESTAQRVREEYGTGMAAAYNDIRGIFTDRDKAKSLVESILDRAAFGVGLGLLLLSSDGNDAQERIREQIRDLGKNFTDPVKIGGEEIIDLVSGLPTQLDSIKDRALQTGAKQIGELNPFADGSVEEPKPLVESTDESMEESVITTNGETSPGKRESSR